MSVTDEALVLDLQPALDELHRAGMPGVCVDVRADDRVWRGAAGVADVDTGRPMTADLRQRIGSVTKTFTAAAVMRQVECGTVALDDPIGRYLPQLVPGERGAAITVRMLINHTSGIPDYLPWAFPSMQTMSPASLDDNRFRRFHATELIGMGLAAPGGTPGATPGIYSNSGYLLLGELLTQLTGATPAECIATDVVARAGLEHTWLPDGPSIEGPYPAMYEAFFGLLDPPRDYSVYDASWVGTGAGMVSTVADLTRFYAALLDGAVVQRSSLEQMQRTVPVIALDGSTIEYGLGLHRHTRPEGVFWGHDGTVWGALAMSWISEDGARQLSVALNLARWKAGAIDAALENLHHQALRP